MCKNKKAKNSIFTAVMVSVFVITGTCVILFFVVLSNIFGEKGLKGNLFDEKVLIKYEISWLKKPRNAVNEKQYCEQFYYIFECEIFDIENFEEYAETVFKNFKLGNYTIAHYVRTVDIMPQPLFCEVAQSDELPDYCKVYDDEICYTFYYSTQTVEKMKEKDNAKIFGDRSLEIVFLNNITDKGMYKMKIRLFGGKLENSNIICEQ